MWRNISIILFIFCIAELLSAQTDTIHLRNASFEDIPSHSNGMRGWSDCGFPGESNVDVQPFFSIKGTWGQQMSAHDGETYLGMVVRQHDTYERVSQQLAQPLEKGSCYSFSVYLSSSDNYMSGTKLNEKKLSNYNGPTLLRIWGGNDYCDRRELLAESPTISNREWLKYDFEFHCNGRYSFIMFEAFFKTPAVILYNGNILVDGASPIVKIACPGEEPLAVVDVPVEATPVSTRPKTKNPTKPKTDPQESPKPDEIGIASAKVNPVPKPPKNRILKNLDRSKIVKGQTIRIDNLYFEADSATIDSNSYDVLEEIAYFLSQNEDIVVEIGGHTNDRPQHDFADKLSTQRAQLVSEYILSLGIDERQIKYKGYGKRKPLASNQTRWGRERNQRVEIRILNVM